MLKVEQTLTCDICGSEMRSDTQIVHPGTQMYKIERGLAGVTQWYDVCAECHIPLLNAITEAKKAVKDAE